MNLEVGTQQGAVLRVYIEFSAEQRLLYPTFLLKIDDVGSTVVHRYDVARSIGIKFLAGFQQEEVWKILHDVQLQTCLHPGADFGKHTVRLLPVIYLAHLEQFHLVFLSGFHRR